MRSSHSDKCNVRLCTAHVIKEMKFTEHVILVARKKKHLFFLLLVFSSFTIEMDFWWVFLIALIWQSHFRSGLKAYKAVLKQHQKLAVGMQMSWIHSLCSLFITSTAKDWLIEIKDKSYVLFENFLIGFIKNSERKTAKVTS